MASDQEAELNRLREENAKLKQEANEAFKARLSLTERYRYRRAHEITLTPAEKAVVWLLILAEAVRTFIRWTGEALAHVRGGVKFRERCVVHAINAGAKGAYATTYDADRIRDYILKGQR